MKTLAPLILWLIPFAAQDGRPAAPPLADAKDQIVPGLTLTLEAGGLQDVRDARLAALCVPEGSPSSPFLPPGPFKASWEGFLSADLGTDSPFPAPGNGGVPGTIA